VTLFLPTVQKLCEMVVHDRNDLREVLWYVQLAPTGIPPMLIAEAAMWIRTPLFHAAKDERVQACAVTPWHSRSASGCPFSPAR